ncbi:7113_t:CDS:2, partial [Funneliformis mosseae]
MSNNPEISNIYVDWLEKSISDEYLIHYEYSDFDNLEPIGNGSFGNVMRANWKNPDQIELPINGSSSPKSSIEIDEDLDCLELTEDIKNYTEVKSSQSNMTNFKNNSLVNINKSSLKSSKEIDDDLEDLEITNFYKNNNESSSSLR